MNEVQQELRRIRDMADRLYTDTKDEPDWERMLVCLLRRFDHTFFSREDRKTTAQMLTPDLKEQAMMMAQLVGMSDLSDLLKHRVCGACEAFLRNIGVDAEEMKEFKASCSFDPSSYNIFEGLEA